MSFCYIYQKRKTKQKHITHLLEWLKSRTLATATSGEFAEQQKRSFIAAGDTKW